MTNLAVMNGSQKRFRKVWQIGLKKEVCVAIRWWVLSQELGIRVLKS